MRKTFFAISLILILLYITLFIVVPEKITIKRALTVSTPERVIDDYFIHLRWHKCWPDIGHVLKGNKILSFIYNDASFNLNHQSYYNVTTKINTQGTNIHGTINFMILNADSTRVEWTSSIQNNKNPVKRLTNLIASKKASAYQTELLHQLKSYLENESNIYGISVRKTTVTDTLVLTIKRTTNRPPSNSDLYQLLEKLRKYIKLSGAKETNKPIYNVSTVRPFEYQTMVAIAINKPISENDNMAIKRMIKANLLETEVVGGWNTVERSFRQLELYIADKKLSSPAIPFARLITDRRKEPDTSKWITKVYYPLY